MLRCSARQPTVAASLCAGAQPLASHPRQQAQLGIVRPISMPNGQPKPINALDEAKNAADCINLARANCRRLDQHKSNIERQGYWPALRSKSTFVLLHDPTLTMLIDINPMDTVNADQDIAPTFEHVISKTHGNMPPASNPLANVYAPSSKLCGKITFERLQILYNAFTQSQHNQHENHQQHHNPTFEHALARLLSRYSNKHTLESKTTRIKNH